MSEADIQFLLDLLKEDKIEEVVERLAEAFPKDKNIVQLSGRLQTIRTSTLRGTLSNDEIIRNRNILRDNTLDVIKLIDEENLKREQPVQGHYHSFYESCLLPVVFLGVVTFFLCTFFPKCELPYIEPVAFPQESVKEHAQKLSTNNVARTTATPYIEEKKLTGFDSEGRKAEYIIFIIRNFNWVLGEISMSERNGEQSEICEHLASVGVEARLNREDFKGIICFGNTSVEEDLSLPKSIRISKEEDRAEFRARFLSLCVSQVLKSRTPIFKANLGKYKLKDEITDYQREIIIIGIVQNDEKVINEEALFNGLIGWHLLEGWEIDIREYSKINQEIIPIERYLN